MPESNYLQEGIQQAATARDATSIWWADTWKNYAVNYALNKQNNEDQLKLWTMMNEYNSPSSQMERFKKAGLNPNLVYSQGTPGNAGSPAGYSPMSASITPSSDVQKQIASAMDAIGMVSNLAQNIVGLMDSGLNLRLKQNQVKQSNFDVALLDYNNPQSGMRYNMPGHSLQDVLNPLSSNFDPLQYLFWQKRGGLPQYWNQFLTGESSRQYQEFRSNYQKYYNENLLPKFDEYQQGKIDLQEIQKTIEGYNRDVMMMMPAEIRGILGPLVDYLSPFLKFIFKRSTVHR